MLTMDVATQIYSILKQPDLKYLTQVFSLIYISSPFIFSFQICVQPAISICMILHQLLLLALPELLSNLYSFDNRMTLNPSFENFWQLIQDWNSYRVRQSFRKDTVCSQPIDQPLFHSIISLKRCPNCILLWSLMQFP